MGGILICVSPLTNHCFEKENMPITLGTLGLLITPDSTFSIPLNG